MTTISLVLKNIINKNENKNSIALHFLKDKKDIPKNKDLFKDFITWFFSEIDKKNYTLGFKLTKDKNKYHISDIILIDNKELLITNKALCNCKIEEIDKEYKIIYYNLKEFYTFEIEDILKNINLPLCEECQQLAIKQLFSLKIILQKNIYQKQKEKSIS